MSGLMIDDQGDVSSTLTALAFVLAILLTSSLIVNWSFGHPTYHRHSVKGAPITDASVPSSFSSSSLPSSPAPPSSMIQEVLPRDLLSGDILSYLLPYDVIILSQTSKFFHDLSNVSRYWEQSWRRVIQTDIVHLEKEEEEEEEEERMEAICKMEYFRRMLIRPYQLSRGHDSAESCYVIIHGKVYDVSRFLEHHPGGDQIILEYAGAVDASRVFELSYHSIIAREMMGEYLMWDPVQYLGRQGTLMSIIQKAAAGGAGGDNHGRVFNHHQIRREDRWEPGIVMILEAIRFI